MLVLYTGLLTASIVGSENTVNNLMGEWLSDQSVATIN